MLGIVAMKYYSIIRSLILLYAFLAHGTFATARYTAVSPIVDINEKARIAQEELYETYYSYLQSDETFLKDESYVNNLVILCDLDRNFPKNGEILLLLINKLEETNDTQGNYLLRKISRLFCLQFHQFICCQAEIPKSQQAILFRSYYHLNNFSLGVDDAKSHPFRLALTKIIISFFMIHNSSIGFNQKRSSWVLALEKFRKKTHELNLSLCDKQTSAEIIDNFADAIEVYALHEPLVQPRNYTRIIVTTLILIAITAAIVYATIKYGPKNYKEFEDTLAQISKRMGAEFNEALMQPAVDRLVANMEQMGANMVTGMNNAVVMIPNPQRGLLNQPDMIPLMVENPRFGQEGQPQFVPVPVMSAMATQMTEGMSTVPVGYIPLPGIPNPNLTRIADNMGDTMARSLVKASVPDGIPEDNSLAMTRIGNNLLGGALQRVNPLYLSSWLGSFVNFSTPNNDDDSDEE